MSGGSVDVIIPTAGARERADLISRAIVSVLQQTLVDARPIVVLNGGSYDPEIRRALAARADIALIYDAEPRVSRARAIGRKHVTAPFFAFLDDDDYLLPHSCSHRLSLFEANKDADVVASSGRLTGGATVGRAGAYRENIIDDPFEAMLEENWLPSASGLYRAATVGDDFFDNGFDNMEWTITAFRLLCSRRVIFDRTETFVLEKQTHSQSTTPKYVYDLEKAIRFMLNLPLPERIKKKLGTRYAASLNQASLMATGEKKYLAAWNYHLRCLTAPGGWRYIGYTRHLLKPGRRKEPKQWS